MEDLTLLTIDRLNVWYSPGKNVLDNFSLELGDHEIVGLIGLNGAGKTTFIKTLSGLISSFRLAAFKSARPSGRGKHFLFRTGRSRKTDIPYLRKIILLDISPFVSIFLMRRRPTA